ncbi:hypothetical protein C8R47DRAFT_1328767 [Mycena vitilis]|nr:hypothetical protein C8R47DRAFT_1328767 [Mycena vitilis]
MAGPCTAGDEETECDCEGFAPKASNPKQCRYCYHLEGHHGNSDASDSDESTVQAILESSMAAVRGPKSEQKLAKDRRKTVSNLFKKAHVESAQGMRPTKTAIAKGKNSKTVIRIKARPAPAEQCPVVKFQSVLIRAQGLDATMQVIDSRVPDFPDIVNAVNMGLAYDTKDVEIPLDATAEDVTDIFRAILPKPFEYFDKIGYTLLADDEDEDGDKTLVAPWVLTMPKRQRLKVVPLEEVRGKDLQRLVDNSKAKINHLTLSTRTAVPEEVLATWTTKRALGFPKHSGFVPDELDDLDPETPGDRPKRKRNQRLSKISDEDSESETEVMVKAKRNKTKRASVKWSRESLLADLGPNVSTSWSGNAVAGPSNLVGPSHNPIDLTRSRSPTPLFFTSLTPPRGTIKPDPSYSGASESDPTIPNVYENPMKFQF